MAEFRRLVRMRDGTFTPPSGKTRSVELPGVAGEFWAQRFAHPTWATADKDGDLRAPAPEWRVYDLRTGLIVGGGKTLNEAIEDSRFKLVQSPDALQVLASVPNAPTPLPAGVLF